MLFVLPSVGWQVIEGQLNAQLPALNEELLLKVYQVRLSKAYFTKDFTEFRTKYPYLCVNGTSSQKEMVRAEARYPSEIKQGSLFIGNLMNVLNKNYE